MPGRIKTESSSDSFWPESSFSGSLDTRSLSFGGKRRQNNLSCELFSAVDEAPDFHNPYSDLNLFLSQKIKQEMNQHGGAKKWSMKIQDELLQKITPDFQKRFPHYRLGISALRKTWEKIQYYLQQIQSQKEAISQDGKLNVHFFIKENLKQCAQTKSHHGFHPHHFAHQLAVKMSECIATIDGVRPKLDHLTKIIWAIQRHLLSNTTQSPYDEYDKIDKLIVKIILEITAKEPQISQRDLEHKVKENLHSLHELPAFASLEKMTSTVSALLADKLYASSAFHICFFEDQKNAILSFIRRQAAFCKISPTQQLSDAVRRILALYSLASQLPKTLEKEAIEAAVRAVYPSALPSRPALPQALYAFISAELVLARDEQDGHSVESVCNSIYEAYEEAKNLPELKANMLEMLIWKLLSEQEKLLENLPYRIGQRMDEEIANTMIDNPQQSFSSIVHMTVQFFQKTKELSLSKQNTEIERKIHTWTMQGDMLCRCIRLDQDAPLLKLISEKWHSEQKRSSHMEFVSGICLDYLRMHPSLAAYAPQVSLRIWILYKYCWYTLFSGPEESSFDRYLKWHQSRLASQSPHLDSQHIQHQLEELCKKTLPLVPFELGHINSAA